MWADRVKIVTEYVEAPTFNVVEWTLPQWMVDLVPTWTETQWIVLTVAIVGVLAEVLRPTQQRPRSPFDAGSPGATETP